MSNIGCIGLGIMSRPMAKRLPTAGYEPFLHDATPLPAEVAQQAGSGIAMARDTPHVAAVLFDEGGTVAQ